MPVKGNELKNLFECAYLLLLVDQFEDGLWGKSITAEEKALYSSFDEGKISEKRKRAESITVTFFAVDAIHTFTRNAQNSAIKRALDCLPSHECDGGYGSFAELISAYPEPVYHILISCRHTATALLTYLLFQSRIDREIIQSVQFLIDHSNKDGGWGVSADPEKEDSDCLSTTYITKLLTKLGKMGIKDFLSKSYRSKQDSVIANGLSWLEKENKKNDGFWVFGDKRMKVSISAAILSAFCELRNYKTKLYQKTLDKIASLQNEDDGGWPLTPEGRSELRSTIWVVTALINSGEDKYVDRIEKGIGFIASNFSKWSHTRNLNAADWAMLLKLAHYKNFHISYELDDEIQNLANTINNRVFKNGDIEYIRKKLPKRFHLAREPILGVLENYRPDIAHKDFIKKISARTPSWLKWVITVIVISVILGIISNYLYDLLPRMYAPDEVETAVLLCAQIFQC